ncbi:MAG: septum formation inhibitor [Prevotellaceae bacterium]|jgi:cell division protein FtsB|nr:septum formation inhibitor [Prevotellaceae bacterium]
MVNRNNIKSKIPLLLRNRYVLTLLVFLLWITVFDRNNLVEWIKTRIAIRNVKQEKTYYEQQLKSVTESMQELQSNNDSLEKFAREHYGFHHSNEDVFVIE